jgi:hypothetical protein
MVSLLFIYNWLLDHLYSTSACCILERKIVFVVCYKTPMNSLKENKPFKKLFCFSIHFSLCCFTDMDKFLNFVIKIYWIYR